MRLWYAEAAKTWPEALPVGNGRLGGMVFGEPVRETIQLNEDSVWSGKKLDRINPDAQNYLPEIRRLIREGNLAEAQRLAMYALSGTPNSQRAYQTAGECKIEMRGLGNIENYERELDLDEGIARVRFSSEGVTYHREVLASWPENDMVIHLWTEENKPFSFDCSLERCRNFFDEVKAEGGNRIRFQVHGPEGGISFCAAASVKAEGGTVRTIGEYLVAEQVTDAVIALDVETSFREVDYETAAVKRCAEILEKDMESILDRHRADYQKLFSRLALHFDRADESLEKLPTDVRLKAAQNGATDLGLLETYFQYGRYLLISSSREGSLPANLQGIWNDSLTPPWDSKFTININTEMNYWIAESGNLSECHQPLFAHLERIKESGKETARRMYGCRGSVAHHNTDLYTDTAPQDHYMASTFWVMGEAWLATHVWEHYLYTNDRAFLREHFDILEQCVRFFQDFLIENPDGYLVVSPSLSPENTYRMADGTEGVLCESPTMDVEILDELFRGYIGACRVLNLDQERISRAEEIRKRFPPLKIGKYGQLQEWMEDYDEPEPGHRHISHLYGIYPGSSLTEEKRPKERRAARVSLERRLANGGGHTGWSRAWIIGLWAAFGEGEKAWENLQAILSMGTFPNLMDNHPWRGGHVFQIDGNLGASAAMLEMLAQCRDGRLSLLPAVTEETGSGTLRGMRLRGGIELSMEWKDGKVERLRLLPDKLEGESLELEVNLNGKKEKIVLKAGEEFIWER
ncbi:MAG: glycoside hydrolase family 95 protein [Eubacteriales bacterium]|nr:glycoside hydrolase family 95 protein [Eubacteriales bacterium]